MDCSNCGSPTASVYTREINGREQNVCLCKECYKRLYPKSDASEVFARLFGNGNKASANNKKSKVCPSCGATLDDFRKTGLVGCVDCYTAFRSEIMNSLRYCQWGTQHTGKVLNATTEERYDMVRDLAREQESLKKQLSKAYSKEEYGLVEELKDRLQSINAILSHSEEG